MVSFVRNRSVSSLSSHIRISFFSCALRACVCVHNLFRVLNPKYLSLPLPLLLLRRRRRRREAPAPRLQREDAQNERDLEKISPRDDDEEEEEEEEEEKTTKRRRRLSSEKRRKRKEDNDDDRR